MTELEIADPLAMKDLAAFTALAHRLDPDGAMRLHVSATVLVATVAPLYPHGLGDSTPLVLAMRMLRLSGPEQDGLDEVVPLANLKDRFARAENATRLPVPPNSVLVSWTGIAPPKGQWASRDRISGDVIRSTAEAGVAEISDGAPEGAGSHAVKALRSRVWSKPMTAVGGTELPGGLAFAADALRFVPEEANASAGESEEYDVFGTSGWLRISTPGGHLLTRA
ncbi:MAG: hypothetical protein L0G69_03490 [Brevibacterium sp.]|uniref:hypothetical protein n=1 Tax=Brevibacterium sandarakinum TaxID=629680 RepID=UPI002655909D|nr:hypothetical protein [Brevibacterium sandarakinum]MDN5585606.1 hypothetical protein [Brevibacterium sp.]MDN5656088.1 hypothetical protein [Brevibacterium sandarakinum]